MNSFEFILDEIFHSPLWTHTHTLVLSPFLFLSLNLLNLLNVSFSRSLVRFSFLCFVNSILFDFRDRAFAEREKLVSSLEKGE